MGRCGYWVISIDGGPRAPVYARGSMIEPLDDDPRGASSGKRPGKQPIGMPTSWDMSALDGGDEEDAFGRRASDHGGGFICGLCGRRLANAGSRANHERACASMARDRTAGGGTSAPIVPVRSQPGGQCRRNPLCVRGYKHGGHGGRCRLRASQGARAWLRAGSGTVQNTVQKAAQVACSRKRPRGGCCEKDPRCVRGYKHGGKGGRCSNGLAALAGPKADRLWFEEEEEEVVVEVEVDDAEMFGAAADPRESDGSETDGGESDDSLLTSDDEGGGGAGAPEGTADGGGGGERGVARAYHAAASAPADSTAREDGKEEPREEQGHREEVEPRVEVRRVEPGGHGHRGEGGIPELYTALPWHDGRAGLDGDLDLRGAALDGDEEEDGMEDEDGVEDEEERVEDEDGVEDGEEPDMEIVVILDDDDDDEQQQEEEA